MPSIADLADRLRALRGERAVFVVGLTGAVAAGKSTLAAALVETLRAAPVSLRVECVATDGFLRPNDELDAAGLTLRKGYPESYDAEAMDGALLSVRRARTVFPGYSHLTYDLDPALARAIAPPDILIVEGLGFTPTTPVDVRLYLDAEEADLETWFVARFLGFCEAAREDQASFYHRFRELDGEGAAQVARLVWREINLPNLRHNIAPLREVSDIVVRKGSGHDLREIVVRAPAPSAL